MSKINFTPTALDKLTCPTEKRRLDCYDTNARGLLLEVRPSGGKTYYLRYVDDRGKTRQVKIADFRDISISQARDRAYELRSKIAMGIDPREEKQVLRSIPTLNAFFDERYLPYVAGYKKSWTLDNRLYSIHYRSTLGRKPIDEITRQEIIAYHFDMRIRGRAASYANRLLALLRYIFNLAIKWEIPGIKKNPTKDIALFKDVTIKERFLRESEVDVLFDAISRSRNPMLKFIVPMLLFTGARMREVLDARWTDFDIVNKSWKVTKTKSGKPRDIPLSEGALSVLHSVPRYRNSPYVFAHPKSRRPYSSIFGTWKICREKAGLDDLRIHDLRHSFASFLVNNGRSLYEVQKILGHSQIKTTQRYAHLEKSTLIKAVNVIPFNWTNFTGA